jgi:hypothetical protein
MVTDFSETLSPSGVLYTSLPAEVFCPVFVQP